MKRDVLPPEWMNVDKDRKEKMRHIENTDTSGNKSDTVNLIQILTHQIQLKMNSIT